jgi:hypothetical protein
MASPRAVVSIVAAEPDVAMGCDEGAALRCVELLLQPASKASPIMATGRIRMAVTLTLCVAVQTRQCGPCSAAGGIGPRHVRPRLWMFVFCAYLPVGEALFKAI